MSADRQAPSGTPGRLARDGTLVMITFNRKTALLYCFSWAVFIYLILPVFIIIPISFSSSLYLEFPPKGFSLMWYRRFFTDFQWVDATKVSFVVAIFTTFFATLLGTMASVGLVRGRFPGKNVVYTLFLSPMIIPLVVMAIALYFLFVRFHLVGTYTGLVMAHTMLAIPFVVINVSAVLHGFDMTLENAAMNLGANRLQSFLRITLPLIAPGIFSGALFAFITSFDEIIIAMFITGTSAVTVQKKIWDSIRLEINPMVSSIASLLILLSVIILVGSEILRRKARKYRSLKE